jgi:DNA-binding LytR/AlgR family response regulator
MMIEERKEMVKDRQPLVIHDFLRGLNNLWPVPETRFPENPFLFVKVSSKMIHIDIQDIFHIEAMCSYVKIHTRRKSYVAYSSISGIQRRLPPTAFIRVHRSHIVRLDSISEVDRSNLMIEKNRIPISPSGKQLLRKRLNFL